jgi:outer membrane protein assembly factor BamB
MRETIINSRGRLNMYKNILLIGIISLFLMLAITPMTLGYNIKTFDDQINVEDFNLDSYHVSELIRYPPDIILDDFSNTNIVKSNQINILKETPKLLDDPIESPWPMSSHDNRHTGRSPYSTANNLGIEKWRFGTNGWVAGGPIIDNDGTIYVGARDLYALYPNGTLKWKLDTPYYIMSTPAIDENGVLYVGTIWAMPNYLFAIHSNNGTIKWKFKTDNHIFSSPAIGIDGTIYFGSEDEKIYAINPNGTLKWKFKTGHAVLSSPAIGNDGTVYCGSHDTYLYAFYPDNGTVKWMYKTSHWVRVSPCIGDDGTIYCVSLDNYLHAVYPNNGTRKWRTNVGAGTSPTIGQDGTIYCGYSKLHAVNPTDGSVKWTFDVQGKIRGATPCNSVDGTIYLGNSEGSDIVAVNPNGTEKWRKTIHGDVESAPCISEDGTVFIGSNIERLYAFGYTGPNPLTPTISGPSSGKPNTPYTYSFTSIDPDDDQVSYYIEWDDGTITDWTAPKPSGEPYTESHTWATKGTYTVRAKAKDADGYESDWGELQVTIPRNKAVSNSLFLKLLEMFPFLHKISIFITIYK